MVTSRVGILLVALLLVACSSGRMAAAKSAAGSHLQCLDPDGKAVDWWIIVKAANGHQFAYFDARMDKLGNKRLTVSPTMINAVSSPVARTLRQIYEDTNKMSSYGWAQYSDQAPDGSTSTYYAHSKGTVAFGGTGGFWLIHSVPSFPVGFTTNSAFAYPSSGSTNGQTMLCLTLDIGEIDDVVAEQLAYYNPQVYDSNVPSTLRAMVPRLVAMLGGQRNTKNPASNVRTIKTSNRVSMRSFAKNAKWGKDLYGMLVAPNLGSDMLVETWMRPTEPSCCAPAENCSPHSISTIRQINLGNGITYPETKDHAKWATTTTGTNPWTCIGDINFNASQYKRGGGTVCLKSANVHAAFQAIIADIDDRCSAHY